MITIKKLFVLLAICLSMSVYCIGQNAETLIRKTFEGYKSAILHDKGEEAINYVDSRTIKYYTDILDVVKNADSTKLNSLSLIDKVTAFSVRHRATSKEINSMKGSDLFVYATKN